MRWKPGTRCCAARSAITSRTSAGRSCGSSRASRICPTSRRTRRCPTRSPRHRAIPGRRRDGRRVGAGSGFRVRGSGFGFGVRGSESRFRVRGSGFAVPGSGCRAEAPPMIAGAKAGHAGEPIIRCARAKDFVEGQRLESDARSERVDRRAGGPGYVRVAGHNRDREGRVSRVSAELQKKTKSPHAWHLQIQQDGRRHQTALEEPPRMLRRRRLDGTDTVRVQHLPE